MKNGILAISIATALVSGSVVAEEEKLNDGFGRTWFSHVNTPHGFATALPKAMGNWEVKGMLKPQYKSNGANGSDKGLSLKARLQINGNYELTKNFRFSTEAWVTGEFDESSFNWENDPANSNKANYQDPIYFEQIQVGFEHKTLGALTVGKQVTAWGSGTIFDQYNLFGLTELQLNEKNDGTKIFYHNKWDDKWLVRAVYRPEAPVFDNMYGIEDTEATWGATLAYDTFSPYARGFDGWGIYYDVNNEQFTTQYGNAPAFGGGIGGGYQYHNIKHDNLVHSLSSYIRTGAWYLAGNVTYSEMDDNKSLDDSFFAGPSTGMGYEDGVGLSSTVMVRYTFDNGIEPLVSVGNDITGTFGLLDLSYRITKQARIFAVVRVADDDETQYGAGAKLFF